MAIAKVIPVLSVITQKPAPKRPKTSPKRPNPSTSRPKTPVSVAHGKDSRATARGKDAIAAAVGDGSSAAATAKEGSSEACAIAAGSGCTAEILGSGALAAVALGISSHSISHDPGASSVAIGFGPFAEAGDGGAAISIGCEPVAQAGEGGYLVFVDTALKGKPQVAVFAVDPDTGIWPNFPYFWSAGWAMPCPDGERIDREGFQRGVKFAKKEKLEV